MKRWKLITLITVAAVALTGFAVLASGVLPYRVYIVHTGSMSPTIPSTSAVIVRVNQYRVGQPISFLEQGSVITHRLVAINSDGTIDTKGDANATNDPWHVPTSAIIGGVVAAPAHLGYWLMYFRNPLGLASILLAALTCWLIWSIVGSAPAETATGASTGSRRSGGPHGVAAMRHRKGPSRLPRALTTSS